MYFVKMGVMRYKRLCDDHSWEREQIGVTRWFCEAVLWTSWVHQGNMRA
eukprot:CAMPEP_0170642210 /NCGR_PEP_ID=MMETSP0224-20130122/41203_1 /TAXON_ID=285029 /ORGANISM="Togula jolla, Strain CCCM 725" /LENGTH=48 /DNA_ID= /DNA_START= /DNA_END= /DNA_ORIENTATION=